MKAAIFIEPGRPLTVEEVDDPTPGNADIVMKVHSCGICGTDLHMTEDHGPEFSLPKGGTPGHEYAGEVVEIGKNVKRFKVGDRICAQPFAGCGNCPSCRAGRPFFCSRKQSFGAGFAEYALVGEQTSVRLHESLSFDDGALVEPLAVGLHGATLGNVSPGDNVLVLGAGAIGLATAFFARRLGAGKVVVAATSRRRERYATALGADRFLVPEAGQSLTEAVLEEFGALPDVVLECAGMSGCLDQAIEVVRPHGSVIAMGFCTAPDPVLPAAIMFKEITLRGSNCYTIDEYAEVVDILAGGALEPRQMVSQKISLDQVPEVFEGLRSANNQCKVQVKPWS